MLRCSLKFNPQSIIRYQQFALWVKMSTSKLRGRGCSYFRGRAQNNYRYVRNDYTNSQNNNGYGSFGAGWSRGGHPAGASDRGSGRAGNPNADTQNLNY